MTRINHLPTYRELSVIREAEKHIRSNGWKYRQQKSHFTEEMYFGKINGNNFENSCVNQKSVVTLNHQTTKRHEYSN